MGKASTKLNVSVKNRLFIVMTWRTFVGFGWRGLLSVKPKPSVLARSAAVLSRAVSTMRRLAAVLCQCLSSGAGYSSLIPAEGNS